MMENGNRKKTSGENSRSRKQPARQTSGTNAPKKNIQGSPHKKKPQRKKSKELKGKIRTNLILLGTVFAFSVTLFLGKVLVSGVPDTTVAEQPLITETVPVTGENKPLAPETVPEKPPEIPAAPAVPAAPPERPPPEPQKSAGTLVFVFDDAGHNLKQLQPFLDLPFPCTIAVLPGLQYSKEAAARIREAGKELILHQPMQAENLSFDPGPGAVMPGMTREEIKEIIRKNIREVGPIAGMNNHEGSLITADRDAMETILELVREEGIFFLDSRTTANTAAPAIAREKNMTIWERSIFLDNSQEKKDIIDAINSGLKIAGKQGSAIMIGHIWSNQLAETLTEMYPELVSQGFSLSTLADIAVKESFDE